MKGSYSDFDFSHLTAAERLLLAQELLDSVYDAVAPLTQREAQRVPWEKVTPLLRTNSRWLGRS